MANVAHSSVAVTTDQVAQNKPLSQTLFSTLAGAVNLLLDNIGGVNLQSQTFTANGTFTTDANLVGGMVICLASGGGGGGGGAAASGTAGGGGGGSGPMYRVIQGLSPSTGYSVSIGAAGTAGPGGGTRGGDGQPTYFNGTVIAYGGKGGGGGATSNQGNGNGGFGASGGGNGGTHDNLIAQAAGAWGSPGAFVIGAGGAGGGGYGNGGDASTTSPGVGVNGGGGAGGTGNNNGAAGGAGICVVYYMTKVLT